jgi:hypothetical protein
MTAILVIGLFTFLVVVYAIRSRQDVTLSGRFGFLSFFFRVRGR